jgi:hypothetical protein
LNLPGGQEDRGRCAVGVGHDGRVGGSNATPDGNRGEA